MMLRPIPLGLMNATAGRGEGEEGLTTTMVGAVVADGATGTDSTPMRRKHYPLAG
jgi:hypothetical protein